MKLTRRQTEVLVGTVLGDGFLQKSGSTYSYARWQSNASPEIGIWRKYFYPNGKKIIPADIGKYLSPLALAVWYMDDGYYSGDKSSFIYLGRISQIEADTLRNAIRNNFGIQAK